jgi:hypothetical protein
MISLARTLELSDLAAAYFVGDDSLIFSALAVNTDNTVLTLSQLFNLSAKVLRMNVGYFCSMFVLQTGERFALVPDPLKRIERLGKAIDAERESSLRERFESFRELVKPLKNYDLYERLLKGMEERYGFSAAAEAAVSALYYACSDYRIFKGLYHKPNTAGFRIQQLGERLFQYVANTDNSLEAAALQDAL